MPAENTVMGAGLPVCSLECSESRRPLWYQPLGGKMPR